jgi:hypothetical protein
MTEQLYGYDNGLKSLLLRQWLNNSIVTIMAEHLYCCYDNGLNILITPVLRMVCSVCSTPLHVTAILHAMADFGTHGFSHS